MNLNNIQVYREAPAGAPAESVFVRFFSLVNGIWSFFHPPAMVDKPAWVNCGNRTWNKYSAFILSSHQLLKDYEPDG